MPEKGPGGAEDLRRRVKEGVSRLRGLDMGDELGVGILSHLAEGSRTAAELVEGIYGLRSSDEGFYPSYRRLGRELRKLESRGLVSRKLLGREKPYRLTDLAVINLARIGGGGRQMPVFTLGDLSIFAATMGLSVPLVLLLLSWVEFSEPVIVAVFGCFCFLLGLSAGRFIGVLRRVF